MDQRLFFLINRAWTHPALDRIMAAASSLDLWLPAILVLVALVAWYGRRRARLFLIALALVLAVGDGLVSHSLKHLIGRPRPFQTMADVRQIDLAHRARPRLLALAQPLQITTSPPPEALGSVAGRSFPSSHTVNNFCVAVVLTLFYRRWGWLYFLTALLVAYSRVYVGAHWPSDVLISAFLGIGVSLLTMAGVQAVARYFEFEI